ncbi:MFS transporter [Dermacoccus barathri]|uniref:MFS transporter n=1 Tax=Dermacoccus barathri TaxID=322601 RepID=A0ABN2BL43_9MICO
MFTVAWGGNQFTPLLGLYRDIDALSTGAVDLLLGAYVLGIMPALLLGGPASDRWGRRPLMLPAPILAIIASVLLAVGSGSPAVFFVGRIFSGLALGLAMVVGGSWIKELSSPPFDAGADAAAGARRASISLTAGFALGAATAAALAQFAPLPAELCYLLHLVITAASYVLLTRAPETHAAQKMPGRFLDDLRVPAAGHRRFLFVVLPMAPWVFGCAGCAYAVLPAVMGDRTGSFGIAFSGLLCLVALGCGLFIQQVGKRFDDVSSARAIIIALTMTLPGLGIAALAARLVSPWLALVAAAVLGLAYGMLLVSGLQEVQRIAGPEDLAGLTAVYYSITYLGFFVPAALAVVSHWLSYPVMFVGGVVLAALSLGVVLMFSRKHLPSALAH